MSIGHPRAASSLLQRWAIYFAERFPPLQYAIALLAFAWAALAYGIAVLGGAGIPSAGSLFSAFSVSFLVFLQLRILDEFKDYEEDARYRPERPVPRGLVTLQGLGRLWLACTVVEIAIAARLGIAPLIVLAMILGYSALMRVEFFARAWLRAHALVYMASHMVIVPMITAFALSCSGQAYGPAQLAAYLGMTYLNFCVFEIGRKSYAPGEERIGVETYSALWGPQRAVFAWVGAIWAAGALAALAAFQVSITVPIVAVSVPLAAVCTAGALRFLGRLATAKGSAMRALSAAWILGIHLAFIFAVALKVER